MGIPNVVIVGRPNVGKSSLLNWLAGKRLAVVDEMAGVTRDRVVYLYSVGDRYFELVDTGGMGIDDADNLTAEIERQIDMAIDAADLVLLVVDSRSGLLPTDEEVNRRLRTLDVPVLCVANKADHANHDAAAHDFHPLGRGRPVSVSTKQNRGKHALIDAVTEMLPPSDDDAIVEQPLMRVAIVGRRNTGKSTFVNALVAAERMIVSDVPGTTRDSVDVRFELDGKAFVAIDTPGLRRSKSIGSNVEYYGMHRAQRSIRRADVALFFLDSMERISKVDKQLASYIAEHYKPCIFVVNKWDLQHGKIPTERWADYLRNTFPTMSYAPIAFITGQTGKNVKALLNHAQMLFKQSRTRVATAQLNRLVIAALEYNPPPIFRGRRPKIYYATQVSVQPPTIVLFCNAPKALDHTYQRYLLGLFRDHLECGEVPIKLYLRKRISSTLDDEGAGEEFDDADDSIHDVESNF